MPKSNGWLWLECVTIFIMIPALFALKLITTPLILIPLLLICVPAFIWLGVSRGFTAAVFWRGDHQLERQYLRFILYRFLVVSLILSVVADIMLPQQFFDLPRNMPFLWLLFILGYPLVSVYPQEMLFRAFFFSHYKKLFISEHTMLWVNALLFGWTHVAYANITAVILAFVGGWFFATTYLKTRSLRLVWLEHSLYGCLIFTIGYGRLFIFEPHLLNKSPAF